MEAQTEILKKLILTFKNDRLLVNRFKKNKNSASFFNTKPLAVTGTEDAAKYIYFHR